MPCFKMPADVKQTSLSFLATMLWPFLLLFFVAFCSAAILQAIYQPVVSVLASPSVDSIQSGDAYSTWSASKFGAIVSLAMAVLITLATVGGLLSRRIFRSNSAIKKCVQNATVIVEPNHSISVTRYLYSKITVDLSRTNFANYTAGEYPIDAIHRLITVRIREAEIPDNLILQLLSCRELQKLDLSHSSISSQAAQWLAELGGVDFVLEGLCEIGSDMQMRNEDSLVAINELSV